jgi:hypothetical protein
VAPPAGTYDVNGRSYDGTAYSGTVTISGKADRYRLQWRVGNSNYKGSGRLAGNLLTVDWGSTTPVVYALSADGSLAGLWDGGAGEEFLTPAR